MSLAVRRAAARPAPLPTQAPRGVKAAPTGFSGASRFESARRAAAPAPAPTRPADQVQPLTLPATTAQDAAPANPFLPWLQHTFQVLLHRDPTPAEVQVNTDFINRELAAGKHIFTVGAEILFFIKIGDEYKADHPLAGWIGDLYRNELGRDPSDDEINQAEDTMKGLAAQGKNFWECCAGLIQSVQGSPEYAGYQAAHPFSHYITDLYSKGLGRAPTLDERSRTEQLIGNVLSGGGNVFTAGAFCDALMRTSPEYKAHHPFADWLEQEFQNTLGRRPSMDEIINCEGAIGKYMGEGHNVFEAGALIDFLIKIGDEYKAGHPAPASGANTNRDQIYLRQPTGWSCAPTSLAMAEAAWGVAAPNNDTVFRLADGMNDRAGVGLPGNASLVAAQAQRDGLQATYNTSREASAVRAALQAGHTCVVNGSLGVTGGHFIYIAGLDEQGQFIVCDPWRPGITRWSDADLNYFTHIGQQNPPGFAEIWR